MSSRSKSRRDVSWGTTRDADGAGRRIYVDNVSNMATVTDFRKFFQNVEGVEIKGHYAFVQFERRIDVTNAMSKHQHNFLGLPVRIRPYKEDPAPRSRTRKDTRSRSRSRSPSRSVSPKMSPEYEKLWDSSPNYPTVEDEEAHDRRTTAMLDEATREFQQQQERILPRLQHAVHTPVPTHLDSVSLQNGQIPNNIKIILQLVLEQNNVLDLSLKQIQNILDYFNAAYVQLRDQAVRPTSHSEPHAPNQFREKSGQLYSRSPNENQTRVGETSSPTKPPDAYLNVTKGLAKIFARKK